jgi:hypothetical protein
MHITRESPLTAVVLLGVLICVHGLIAQEMVIKFKKTPKQEYTSCRT